MEQYNPISAVIMLSLALAVCVPLARWCGVRNVHARTNAIDGLRGFCATGMFVHHSCIWNDYLQTRIWQLPASRLYANLGLSAVALFFMITSFLFFGKLLDGRKKPIDWRRHFVSRLTRLSPMYFLAMSLVVLLAFWVSGPVLQIPRLQFAHQMLNLLAFNVAESGDVNAVGETAIAIGVSWTLRYEWIYYLAMPLMALCMGVAVTRRSLIPATLLALGVIFVAPLVPAILACFILGAIVQLLSRVAAFTRLARRPLGSFIALLFLVLAARADIAPFPLYLYLFGAFAFIAAGSNLFGALTAGPALILGEMSYSLYLLHPVVLFFIFKVAIGLEAAARFSQVQYWTMMYCIAPLVILLCYSTFRLIEYPAMRSTDRITAWWRAYSQRAAGGLAKQQ